MTDAPSYDYSIVIPAYNEERRIQETLNVIRQYVQSRGLNAEILVCDDGSQDRTSHIVQAQTSNVPGLRLLRSDVNHGKGRAVRRGVENAQGRLILFTDADSSTPIEELEALQEALQSQHADVAVGSRYLKESQI